MNEIDEGKLNGGDENEGGGEERLSRSERHTALLPADQVLIQ